MTPPGPLSNRVKPGISSHLKQNVENLDRGSISLIDYLTKTHFSTRHFVTLLAAAWCPRGTRALLQEALKPASSPVTDLSNFFSKNTTNQQNNLKTENLHELTTKSPPSVCLSRIASECLGLPRNVSDCLGLSRTASDCLALPRNVSCCLGLSHTASECLGLPRNVSCCLGLSHTASECLGLPRNVSCCLGLSHTASECLGLPRNVSCCLGLSHTASECLGLPRIVSRCLGLSRAASDCLALPRIVSHCLGLSRAQRKGSW
ncbi:hypothetical protein V9T40_003483 [Parthenolecanium corni]|uniref:Uncharacterized protein n=1 Tax=Parthenolecanium corni TaxID=536013 RepID=A0AAN9Y9R5_9HEMI